MSTVYPFGDNGSFYNRRCASCGLTYYGDTHFCGASSSSYDAREQRLSSLEVQFVALNNNVNKLLKAVDALSERIDNLDRGFDVLNEHLGDVEEALDVDSPHPTNEVRLRLIIDQGSISND